MKKLKSKYSGKESKKFWNAIDKLSEKKQDKYYSLGVALQGLEDGILNELNKDLKK